MTTTEPQQQEQENAPSIGPTPSAFPNVFARTACKNSHTGVSTLYTHTLNTPSAMPHWYALRTTYGREKTASEYITQHGGSVFYPTLQVTKVVDGKRRVTEVSRLPNIFFAYGTEQEIQAFVYDNVNLPFLRFYYKHTHSAGRGIRREPLIVPDDQMQTLRIICEAEANRDVLLLDKEIQKFQTGEKVRVIDGDFKGVTGIVARFHGQQRVGVVVEGIMTAITAYIPSAFLERIDSTSNNNNPQ